MTDPVRGRRRRAGATRAAADRRVPDDRLEVDRIDLVDLSGESAADEDTRLIVTPDPTRVAVTFRGSSLRVSTPTTPVALFLLVALTTLLVAVVAAGLAWVFGVRGWPAALVVGVPWVLAVAGGAVAWRRSARRP